jgi:DNA-binding transcriptional regulator LsrR (DeoR family)
MPQKRSVDLLLQAARLYYVEGRCQKEVAECMQLSPSAVSRIIIAAREQGIVEFRIETDPGRVRWPS